MRQRCSDPNHVDAHNYLGRGITVCDRWQSSFANFLADMGRRPSPRHTIDRIDNDKGYSPENCRWATPAEQGLNRRGNRRLTYRDETLTLTEWAHRVGLSRDVLKARLALGWSIDRALTEPSRKKPGSGPRRTRTEDAA